MTSSILVIFDIVEVDHRAKLTTAFLLDQSFYGCIVSSIYFWVNGDIVGFVAVWYFKKKFTLVSVSNTPAFCFISSNAALNKIAFFLWPGESFSNQANNLRLFYMYRPCSFYRTWLRRPRWFIRPPCCPPRPFQVCILTNVLQICVFQWQHFIFVAKNSVIHACVELFFYLVHSVSLFVIKIMFCVQLGLCWYPAICEIFGNIWNPA